MIKYAKQNLSQSLQNMQILMKLEKINSGKIFKGYTEGEYHSFENKDDFKLKVSDHRRCQTDYTDSRNTGANIYLMSIIMS